MSYLTLNEAAKYATNKSGQTIEPENLLRAGVQGILILCAPFGFGAMYNATIGQEEDFRADLLVIPPSHLLEIETEGSAMIQAAHSLDGKTLYFPVQSRTREQLRVLVAELDRFIPFLQEKTKPQTVAENGNKTITSESPINEEHFKTQLADSYPSIVKAAKVLGINLDDNPNLFSNGWPDRLPLNDIAKLQFPDDETAQKELIQLAKRYIEHNTFKEGSHYFINESDSDNPILAAGAFHYYCSFLLPTKLNDITLDWLKAQNWPNQFMLKELENGLDSCLDYELICRYWASGKKLFDSFYNENELKEKIITAIQNGALRAKIEKEVRSHIQNRTDTSYIEVFDKSEIRRITNKNNCSFYNLDGNYIRVTINNADFYGWLVRAGQWPLHEGCLLNCWFDEQLLSSDPKEHLEALDCMYAYISNGKAIDWNYWANREFSSYQAARLVNYIDPIEWPENDFQQGKIPGDLLKEMRRLDEWLNQKSETWKFNILIPALAEYSAIADNPINPPFGMVEVVKKSEINGLILKNEPSTTEQAIKNGNAKSSGYSKRNDEFQDFLKDPAIDPNSLTWPNIQQILMKKYGNHWLSGFKDWKKQQPYLKKPPGRRPT